MAKRRAGLHKEITAIFGGAPVTKERSGDQPPYGPGPDRASYEQGQPKPSKADLGPPAPPKASVAAASLSEAPKGRGPVRSVARAIPVEQPKVGTAPAGAVQTFFEGICERIKSKLFAPKPGVNPGRQKAMAVMVPVLFIAFIFVFTRVLGGLKGKRQVPTGPPPTKVVSGSVQEIDWQIPDAYPVGLRDPMQFGSVASARSQTGRAGTDQIIVTGIISGEDNPSALIGARIVRVGDEILGATVVGINRDSVEFEMNGKRWTQEVGL